MRAGIAALAAVVMAAALPSTAAAGWPFYGHDLANSRNAPDEGPSPEQVGALSQAWAFASATGDFTGTPAVGDGVVVAGDHGGWVYALDAVTGKKLWSKDAGAPINGSAAIDADAPGGPTAYVPVAQTGRPRLLALSLRDGTQRWDAALSDQPDASVYGSPVFWNGALYIGTSGPNNDDSRARGSIVAVDQDSGAIRWRTFTVPPGSDGAAVWSTPAIDTATGRLFVGTGNNYHEPTTDTEDAILALDAATGRIVALYQATSGDTFAGGDNPAGGPDYDFGASVNLFDGPDGTALAGEGQKSGLYWAVDRASLRPVWHTMVGPGGYLGGIIGSTASDGERIYGGNSLSGQVFALGHDGSLPWETNETGGVHFSAATIAHGVLYTVDPNGTLNARDPKTGAVLTSLSLGGPSFGGVSATGGALYAAVGIGPPPEPAPQADGSGSIIAFGDTSRSGAPPRPAAARPPRRIRLTVTPRRVTARHRAVFRFRATDAGQALDRVTIRLAGRRVTTDGRGRARLTLRLRRPGRYAIDATRQGRASGRVTVRVISRGN